MKYLNIHDNPTNDNTSSTNTTNSSKGTPTSRLQDFSEKIEETKSSNTETPNPKKAPLNYIDNMGEWEEVQKKYVEDVAKKQQELMAILGTYEDKTEETERFRVAKSELEIKMEKIMGIIVDKLKDYDDFLLQVYGKLFNKSEGDNTDNRDSEEIDNTENHMEAGSDTEEDIGTGADNEESENEGGDENDETEEKENNPRLAEEIANILGSLGVKVSGVSIVPMNMLGSQELGKGELLDDATEIITRFLSVMERGNWKKHKQLLDKTEIEGMENLHKSIKKYLNNYLELLYQIDLIEAKIDKLENEENTMYSKYYNSVKEAKKMEEDMEKLNETYFLNSYLSTKNAPLDNFVSDSLVEKQISTIIELNKQGKVIPKTILLCGSINSGKSYAANVLATELGRKMYHIKSYDIFTGGFSDPNAMLDAIFTGAIKKKEPCIIFLDEIESYTQGYDGSPYQNLLENTIRHHVSKIRESSLDIMVIGAISDKKKVGPDLFKQDVFSQQIFFTGLDKEKAEVLFKKLIEEKGVKLLEDVNIHKLFEKRLKNMHIDPEYMKKIIAFTIDFSRLNKSLDPDNITLSQKDFDDAIDYIEKNINASKVGYYLKMMNM